MSIIIKNSNNFSEFVKCPPGNHQAVCKAVFDIHFQKRNYNGQEKFVDQILIVFEINERIHDGEFAGERFNLSKRFTKSIHEKSALRQTLENWFSKRFSNEEIMKGIDIEKIVGQNCLLNVSHREANNRIYVNIGAITSLPKGMKKMTIENLYQEIPEWIQKLQIQGLQNKQLLQKEEKQEEEELQDYPQDDDIPF